MTYSYSIDAQAKGVTLNEWNMSPGDRVVIQFTGGSWTCNPNVPPSSYDANGNDNYIAKPGYLYSGIVEGYLVAGIGEPAEAMFAVGNYGIVGDDTSSGYLWVACNDDWNAIYGAGYVDNQGSINIDVSTLSSAMKALRTDAEIVKFIESFKSQITASVVGKLGSTIQDVYAASRPQGVAKSGKGQIRPAKKINGRRR